jgi:diguanylate cyclase (GGDEF)-like protein/PAS domain S-box-containing protein
MRLPTLRPVSLKTRVTLAMGVVFIGFVSVLSLVTVRNFETEFRNALFTEHFSLVSALASNIDDKLRLSHGALIASARHVPPKALLDADTAQRFLDEQDALHSIFDNGLFLISRDGKIIAESPFRETRRGRDISFRDFFRNTVITNKPYISKPYLSTHSPGQPALMMTVPLLDAQGEFIGMLEGSFDLLGKNFLADLVRVRIGSAGYIVLADRERLIIVHSEPKRVMTPAAAPGQNPLYDRAIAGFDGSGQTMTSSGVPMFTTYKHLASVDWLLSASIPVTEAEAPLRKAQAFVFAAIAGGTLVALVLVWIIMKYMMSPLARLTRHVQELPHKSGPERLLAMAVPGEIGALENAFNGMVQTMDRQQENLRISEARFRDLTELSTDWYWEQDANFRFVLMSQGLNPTQVKTQIGKARWELPIVGVSEAQWDAHRQMLDRHEAFKDFLYQIKTEAGELRWFSISGVPIFDDGGEFAGYRGIGSDITNQKMAEKQIRFLAYHDALTGLPNRLLMQDRFEQAMAHAQRANTKVALLFLDLDNFKSINDTLGHDTGDVLLQQVAVRLSECVRDTDTICRQGGDEFLILLRDLPDAEVATAIMLKIMERVREPVDANGQEVSTSVSMGATIFPDDGTDFETLLKKADMAMYQAKEAGRNAYRFFDEAMNIEAAEHLMLSNGLRRAIGRDEFVLHYQPQISLATGLVTGVEALLRWNHPALGLVEPGRFIPVAEENALIVPIGEWVLREACRQAVSWTRGGLPEMTVAVNLSAVQFKRGDVEQSVMNALADSGLNPALLELELTESILLQNVESVLNCVKRLKQLDVKLSIDDFGTGYSSLSYLKRFDIDKLKIDQSFVRDLATDPDDAAIVQAIIQMARSLNLKTIAEGVETTQMLEQLRVFQCDEVQGYYFARPMPAAELEVFLRNFKKSR